MGQNRHFKHGQHAPNNGYYVEVGETGSMVTNPKKIKLKAGERFPETTKTTTIGHTRENPENA